jgi:hypothetical protein
MNDRPHLRIVFIILFGIIAGGCALFVGIQLDQEFGPSSPQNRLTKPTEILRPDVSCVMGVTTPRVNSISVQLKGLNEGPIKTWSIMPEDYWP